MSQPSEAEVQQLRQIAADLREVHEERGHRVEQALGVDSAFGSSMSRSWLGRDLTVEAISEAASQRGLDFRPVKGLGREFRFSDGGVDRRYRLRKASKRADGTYVIIANSDSALTVDEDTLFPEEAWVLGYTLSADCLLEDVFIAPIVDRVEGRPGYLVLGRVIELVGAPTPPAGFQPRDEDLLGFDDEDVEQEEFGS